MKTVVNIAHDRLSDIAYISDEVYETLVAWLDWPAGTLVRLVGETPETIGFHPYDSTPEKSYVVVMEAEAKTAQWVGISRDKIRLVE